MWPAVRYTYMTVYEADVPGVGRKFEIELEDGGRAIAMLHHDGRRELFYRPDPDADSEELLDLTAREANQLGTILAGGYFESVDTTELSVPLGDAIIEWTTVPEESAVADGTLGECNVRGQTGASVIAIQRGEETIANPGPDVDLRPGDILVTLGTREEQAAVADLVSD